MSIIQTEEDQDKVFIIDDPTESLASISSPGKEEELKVDGDM
jgi:hypothetical protein